MTIEHQNEFVGTARLAGLLGISPRTLERMVVADKIQPDAFLLDAGRRAALYNFDTFQRLKTALQPKS
jgi:hypothetical protein